MSAPTWELGKYVGYTPGRSPFSSDDDANNVPSSSPEENTKVSPLSQHSFFIPLWQRCIPASGRLSFAPFKLVIVHRLRKTGDTHEKARMVLQVGLNGVFLGSGSGETCFPGSGALLRIPKTRDPWRLYALTLMRIGGLSSPFNKLGKKA